MFTIDFSDHTGLVETSWFDQIDQLRRKKIFIMMPNCQ